MGTPERVRKAKVTGNTEALSAMGRGGAKVTNEIKAEKSAAQALMDERIAELRTAREEFRRHQSGEDLLPPDPIN